MDKRVQAKESSSKPLQFLVGPEVLEYLPCSCTELNDMMALQPPETSIAVGFSADIFQYHDTQEEFEAYVTTQDVVNLLSMHSLNSSCLQIFMRYLQNKCELLKVNRIHVPKKACNGNEAPDFYKPVHPTCHYGCWMLNLQCRSHWMLIVVCPQRHVALFFDPMGKNLDGLVIKGRINMAFRSLRTEKSQEGLTWRLVQCPRQEIEAESGYYVMRYMYEIVTLHHQSHVNLEECFQLDSYTQQQINQVRDIWARYFIDECT